MSYDTMALQMNGRVFKDLLLYYFTGAILLHASSPLPREYCWLKLLLARKNLPFTKKSGDRYR